MLVKYFPDQAGEVVKYIRKAGYGDGEVLDLIDRTAGYNSNTAYLYQGKAGRNTGKASAETERRVTPDVHSLRHPPPPNQEKQPGQDGEPRSPYNHLHLPRMEPFLRGGTFIRS